MEMKLLGCLYNHCLTCIIGFQLHNDFFFMDKTNLFCCPVTWQALGLSGYTVPHYC